MDLRKRIIALANKIKISSLIEDVFEYSEEELLNMLRYDIDRILEENNVSEDEMSIEDMRFYGSYTTGKNKKTSDLDIVLQYSGSMREDTAFDILHSESLFLTDKNGHDVIIDINPINTQDSGTIDEYLGYLDKLAPKS